jgi:hypothetical protein
VLCGYRSSPATTCEAACSSPLAAWSRRPRHAPTADESVEIFLRIIEMTASLGVGCTVEYVVRQQFPADL